MKIARRIRIEFEFFQFSIVDSKCNLLKDTWVAFSLELPYRKAVGSQSPRVAAAATLGYGINWPFNCNAVASDPAQPVPGWKTSALVPRVKATLGF